MGPSHLKAQIIKDFFSVTFFWLSFVYLYNVLYSSIFQNNFKMLLLKRHFLHQNNINFERPVCDFGPSRRSSDSLLLSL